MHVLKNEENGCIKYKSVEFLHFCCRNSKYASKNVTYAPCTTPIPKWFMFLLLKEQRSKFMGCTSRICPWTLHFFPFKWFLNFTSLFLLLSFPLKPKYTHTLHSNSIFKHFSYFESPYKYLKHLLEQFSLIKITEKHFNFWIEALESKVFKYEI